MRPLDLGWHPGGCSALPAPLTSSAATRATPRPAGVYPAGRGVAPVR